MQIRHAKLSDAEKIAQLEAASFSAAEAATPESLVVFDEDMRQDQAKEK